MLSRCADQGLTAQSPAFTAGFAWSTGAHIAAEVLRGDSSFEGSVVWAFSIYS